MTTLAQLKSSIERSWAKETSYFPEVWSPENPAWWQCAVTSLVVQDFLWGEIVYSRATTPDGSKISHYFNQIEGVDTDLTRMQFPGGTIVPSGVAKKEGFASTREFMLSSADTKRRYEILKEAVAKNLETSESLRP